MKEITLPVRVAGVYLLFGHFPAGARYCSPMTPETTLAVQTEPLAYMDSESLGKYVAEKMTGILVGLAEVKPYVEELWRRFDAGETINGCRTREEYCDRILHRTSRAVRYMLAGGNPVSKRKPAAAVSETVSEPLLSEWEYVPEFLTREESDSLYQEMLTPPWQQSDDGEYSAAIYYGISYVNGRTGVVLVPMKSLRFLKCCGNSQTV